MRLRLATGMRVVRYWRPTKEGDLSSEYVLVVRFTLNAGAAEGFDKLVAETVPLIAENEPGTLTYTVHVSTADPNVRIFYEAYADKAAFEAHEEQPHTKRFLKERGQYLDGFTVDFCTPLVGLG
jgi:quinol monooxygenase YgiN